MKNKADGIYTLVLQRPYVSRYGIQVRLRGQRPLCTVITMMMLELDSTVKAEMERTA